MNSNQLINRNFTSIEQMQELVGNKQKQSRPVHNTDGKSFGEILDSLKTESLTFSKHANERLKSRNIDLSNAQLERLSSGTKKAMEKGIKESLVMVDDYAFIVNTKNNTVITAVSGNDDKIFTNIDGAVIA